MQHGFKFAVICHMDMIACKQLCPWWTENSVRCAYTSVHGSTYCTGFMNNGQEMGLTYTTMAMTHMASKLPALLILRRLKHSISKHQSEFYENSWRISS